MGKVYSVGENDADYEVSYLEGGKQHWCNFYVTWKGIMRRSYSIKYKINNPTYLGVYVCKEWLTFSNFKKWMEKQDWQGKCLDKDILFKGNKVYSPRTCVFVSAEVNSSLLIKVNNKGKYPTGVHKDKRGNFVAQIALKGKSRHIGQFKTPMEAHKAWQGEKIKVLYAIATSQQDERIKKALLSRCSQLQYEYDSNIETLNL